MSSTTTTAPIQYFLTRPSTTTTAHAQATGGGEGAGEVAVPLIPADLLPPWVVVHGVPAGMRVADAAGMTYVGCQAPPAYMLRVGVAEAAGGGGIYAHWGMPGVPAHAAYPHAAAHVYGGGGVAEHYPPLHPDAAVSRYHHHKAEAHGPGFVVPRRGDWRQQQQQQHFADVGGDLIDFSSPSEAPDDGGSAYTSAIAPDDADADREETQQKRQRQQHQREQKHLAIMPSSAGGDVDSIDGGGNAGGAEKGASDDPKLLPHSSSHKHNRHRQHHVAPAANAATEENRKSSPPPPPPQQEQEQEQ
ncbi:hypothetical protein N3K66_001170 [Trichothecium roseum]|uniref:Uncharacterized protein n=1 Tax=Trichothecium roseum TaxID=47278 RepID=A0ACC0VFH5_9HYPO|nr:hypothetical protein N3K66_001170 [Trichothecium roseum]